MILDLFLISVIICFIIDCSGFINNLKKILLKHLYNVTTASPNSLSIKPLDCSLCMIFWTGLIYIIFNNDFSLINLAVVSILSLLSSNISGLLFYLKELFSTIESYLYSLLNTSSKHKINK